jgi:flagellar assembly protein FliH
MSSRICRTGDAAGAPPIEWRAFGTLPARGKAAQKSGAPLSAQAQQEGDTASPGRDREMETRAAAAYQQGAAAGEAAATQRLQARMDPQLAALTAIVAELAGMRKKFRVEAEEATVKLALAIARRVLHRELVMDPDALLGLVKAAFQKCDARETHKLRLSPVDVELVREHRERLNLPPAVEIAADASLTRGSAIFETSRGELDASLDTQFVEIERGLTDVLKRRHA